MKFITKEILDKIPPLYSQESKGEEAIVHVKWFTPDSSWTWYATELDPDTNQAFGLVVGHDTELGYFNLNELQSIRGLMGLPVERDLYFQPKTLAEGREKLH